METNRSHKILTCFLQSISPGLVNTEIIPEEQRKIIEKIKMPILEASDVSNAVLYVLSTPPHVQVIFQCFFELNS